MTEASQFRRHPHNKILTTPVAHDPILARRIGRARFKAATCASSIRSPSGTLASDILKDCDEHSPRADASDDALIKAIGRGERHAMALLYQRHHVPVYRFALRITGNASSAEDVVSNVFLEVWRQAVKFKSRTQVSTWLLAIARNKSWPEVRRHSPYPGSETIEIHDTLDDAETSAQNGGQSESIRRGLSQLSAVQKEVIDLVYYHEKSIAEVARIVGVPASTVKTRMFNARRRIGIFLKATGRADI
jgi:RNA polymerase sigma-70 factor (ECF subfamily)